jgi:hypothetical protein
VDGSKVNIDSKLYIGDTDVLAVSDWVNSNLTIALTLIFEYKKSVVIKVCSLGRACHLGYLEGILAIT